MASRKRRVESIDFDEFVHGLQQIAERLAVKHVEKFAKGSVIKFKMMIESQSFKSFKEVPLSEGWAVYKASAGLDPRTMISTGNYLNAIKAIKVGDGYRIGFTKGEKVVGEDGNPRDITYEELAQIHENGSESAGIPARPHWGPFAEILRDEVKRIGPDYIKELKLEVAGRLNVTKKTSS